MPLNQGRAKYYTSAMYTPLIDYVMVLQLADCYWMHAENSGMVVVPWAILIFATVY